MMPPAMPDALILDDRLALADVVAVARDHCPVELAPAARERIAAGRDVTAALLARGERVYGLTTGVGALKRVAVGERDQAAFNRLLLLSHRTGTGPDVAEDVVRAAMLAQLAGFGRGRAGVRPELADHLVAALNAGLAPRVRTTGSLGQSDLGPLADLAEALTGDGDWATELERLGLEPWLPTAKEALAFVNSNAFTLGWTALALADVEALLDAFDLSAMLTFEGMVGNVEALDPAIADARPVPGLAGADRPAAGAAGRRHADRGRPAPRAAGSADDARRPADPRRRAGSPSPTRSRSSKPSSSPHMTTPRSPRTAVRSPTATSTPCPTASCSTTCGWRWRTSSPRPASGRTSWSTPRSAAFPPACARTTHPATTGTASSSTG